MIKLIFLVLCVFAAILAWPIDYYNGEFLKLLESARALNTPKYLLSILFYNYYCEDNI